MSTLMRRTLALYLKRHGRAALQDLRRSQWLDPEAHELQRRQRVGRLLCRASSHVPYFRQRLNLNELVDAQGLVKWEAFRRLPILDKDEIRAHWEEFQAEGNPGGARYQNYSGGSSGEPLRFVQDAAYRCYNGAVKQLVDEWGGIHPGDRIYKVWGSMRDHSPVDGSLKSRLASWAQNTHWVDPFTYFTQSEMEALLADYNHQKADQLMGYTEFVLDIAKTARAAGHALHKPRSIMTTATTLTDDMRTVLATTFGAPVFNRYGSREMGDMACDCEAHEGLHVMTPSHHVEILDDAGRTLPPGERGYLVVTCLTNLSMPFIRYRIGDLASWTGKPCRCGRPWPLLAGVDGRTADFFYAADGSKFYPGVIHAAFFYRDWIKRFQAVQEALDHVVVSILPRPGQEPEAARLQEELKEIRASLEGMLGTEIRLDVVLVDDIPPSPSGKFAHLVSKVAPPTQE